MSDVFFITVVFFYLVHGCYKAVKSVQLKILVKRFIYFVRRQSLSDK
jgi:hypothetical protein